MLKSEVHDGGGRSSQSLRRIISIFDESWGNMPDIDFDSKLSMNRPENSCIDVPTRLQYFKSALFATILEDTITQFSILGECNNELRIIKTQADLGLHLALKYDIKQPEVTDELENIDRKALGKEQYKLDKLSSDRKHAYESMVLTYAELTLHRSFQSLVARVQVVVDRETDRAVLIEDEARNKVTRREVARQLRLQRNHHKSSNYEADTTIESLKMKVQVIGGDLIRTLQDSLLISETKSRYIANWQNARTEQHQQTIADKEEKPIQNIESYKMKADGEQRAHGEVELIINLLINEKLDEIEKLMNKYDKDMEAMDLRIQILKNDHTNKLEYRKELEETLARRDKLMKDWTHFKDEREKARVYRENMTNAAISVQAWWRGLLVRKQLGPYKPAKKPKPAGKKK